MRNGSRCAQHDITGSADATQRSNSRGMVNKMADTLIKNALIIPMTAGNKFFNGCVRVRDGVIAEVSAGSAAETDRESQVIDAGGSVLMPGLINAHTHLYQVLLRAVWEDLELMPWLKRI